MSIPVKMSIFAPGNIPATNLNFQIMCIQVNVFQNMECKRQNKLAFSRLVDWPDNVEFPFNKVLGALDVLYSNSIVVFENYSEK